MIYLNNKEVGEIYMLAHAISEVYQMAVLVWQAGNFITSEGAYMQTAEGDMFYCKEDR